MSAAQDKVINVTELLEIIIYFLPQGAILNRAQRVCKKWQAIISKSKDIQEKLFLRPVSRGHTVVWEGHSPYGIHEPGLHHMYNAFNRRRSRPEFQILEDGTICKYSITFCPTASWRGMLLSQPPPTSVHVDVITVDVCTRLNDEINRPDNMNWFLMDVDKAGGVRFADLIEVGAEFVKKRNAEPVMKRKERWSFGEIEFSGWK